METRMRFHRALLIGLMLMVLALLLLVNLSVDLPRAKAQQPQAILKRSANGYQYFFPVVAKACEEYCVGWAVGGAADGYGVILRTDDSGVTWRRQGQVGQIPNVDLSGVSAVDAQNAWAVGGKTILRTRDGGATWEQQTLPAGLPADFELFKVKALNTNTAFVVGGSGVLLQTTDGATWIKMPTSPDLPLIQYSDVDAVDATHVWAVGGVISGTDPCSPRCGLGIAFYNGTQWGWQGNNITG
ncbi:MAG: YCF48-related protein, partial [Chloroflexota bacterium]